MARNFRRQLFQPLTITQLLLIGWVLAFELGCDDTPPKVNESAQATEKGKQLVTAAKAEPESSNGQGSNPTEAKSTKPVAPQADAKPADPPLDPLVDVEKLMAARLPADELNVGWIQLFDGQSFIGWRNAGDANWTIEDGALVADKGTPGLLCTPVRFSDFELTLEFKGADKTNSGVFLRTPSVPTDPAIDCYELNIAPPENPFPTGSLVGRIKVCDQVNEPEAGEWHILHAMVDREHVQAWVNGQQSVDYVDTTGLTAGYIGLQFREGEIRFRNIKVRPITYAILPAKDLKDFNTPAGSVKAELTDNGSLTLTGGKGHVELLQSHANCCIQFAVQTLAENVNSGLFFRCIPGEDMNGYECQVHHGFKDDRRRPVDGGMGAIFRRQNAKAVLSDSVDKTFLTVVADGPMISTWVNGVQVVDWEDTRAPNENPRKGVRTEAGTTMLQAHDQDCKVRFDSLSFCPLP
ncbi:MAG TPA: family 16 glycoside hydrolase [Pirellula sp.]|nr:family 16 glycoside hydrolase [Pirellula sp.]